MTPHHAHRRGPRRIRPLVPVWAADAARAIGLVLASAAFLVGAWAVLVFVFAVWGRP